MHASGAFQLVVEPETETRPMRATVALVDARPDERGLVKMTPECMSLDVLEGCLNALQDELDMVRADARRAFMRRGIGHA
jgi:hypothetical protein